MELHPIILFLLGIATIVMLWLAWRHWQRSKRKMAAQSAA